MLFNSGVFLQFFGAFLLLYWLLRNNLVARNILIVIASYLFYGWWDYRFLTLIIFSSLIDYFAGIGIARTEQPRKRKWILFSALSGNLIILGFFKYYDFFVTSFGAVMQQMQIPIDVRTLGIILPVGISFYTFQTMSYSIDVYRRELPATSNLINFLAYVSFFPQLVAGPIERARHLLPQFEHTRRITLGMVQEGVWLMVWGMFKKVVLADNLAPLVDMVYQGSDFSGPTVVLGTIAFALQIYCDFSGYSDIARGTALILGFDIMMNFNLPYLSTSLREFWQRWHISLSTWLRDYLYIPLGGNRQGNARTSANLITTMTLGGLWHGAAWNFVLWGVWHGGGLVLARLPSFFSRRESSATQREMVQGSGRVVVSSPEDEVSQPNTATATVALTTEKTAAITKTAPIRLGHLRQVLCWTLTMLFVLYGWLLFRARSFDQIVAMTRALCDFSTPFWLQSYVLNLAVFALPLVLMEALQARYGGYTLPLRWPTWVKSAVEGLLVLAIILFWEKEKVPFIYFQF